MKMGALTEYYHSLITDYYRPRKLARPILAIYLLPVMDTATNESINRAYPLDTHTHYI